MTPTPGQADDAFLRLVFNEVAAAQVLWNRPMPSGGPPYLAWKRLYDLVVEQDGGLAVLQHIEHQRREIERLQHEIDRLNGLLARPAPAVAMEEKRDA